MSDSDHVVLFDGETREIAREIVRCGGLDGRFTELMVAQEEMKTGGRPVAGPGPGL